MGWVRFKTGHDCSELEHVYVYFGHVWRERQDRVRVSDMLLFASPNDIITELMSRPNKKRARGINPGPAELDLFAGRSQCPPDSPSAQACLVNGQGHEGLYSNNLLLDSLSRSSLAKG